jgi:hypothetical protein
MKPISSDFKQVDAVLVCMKNAQDMNNTMPSDLPEESDGDN